jgi:hypothetical protein
MPSLPHVQVNDTNFTQAHSKERHTDVDELISQSQFVQALALLVPFLEANPLDIECLARGSVCVFQLGDTKSAIAMLEVIVENCPDSVLYRMKLGELRQLSGDVEGAIVECQKVLKLDPTQVWSMSQLNQMRPFGRESKWVARLRKFDKSNRLPATAQAQASNTLGQVEAASGRYTAAFRHFARAKAAQKRDFNFEAVKRWVDDHVAHFRPKTHTNAKTEEPRMIFVCGLPRSGTTLAERILTRHEQVGSVGESTALSILSIFLRQSLPSDQNLWQWLGRRSDEEISAFRSQYFRMLFKGLPNKHQVIVDKSPLNCLNIGIAQCLLPEAKFLFMMRHPLDVGLSNFSTIYGERNEFAARLPWIGMMTREVYRSAEDYTAKLGGQMRMQSYRALVQSPDQQIRAMVDHAGLTWQEACLNPEKGSGTVLTASTLQVRQKINTNGLDRWKACEKQLQPLADALGGQDWLQHWQDLDKMGSYD